MTESEMPKEIWVYTPTGDIPIRVWYPLDDINPEWQRKCVKYTRSDRLDVAVEALKCIKSECVRGSHFYEYIDEALQNWQKVK